VVRWAHIRAANSAGLEGQGAFLLADSRCTICGSFNPSLMTAVMRRTIGSGMPPGLIMAEAPV
jgi:hypothetical protein